MGARYLQKLPCLVCSLGAIAIAIYMMAAQSGNLPIVFASVFFILICTTDTLYSKIHNVTSLSLALIGFGYHFWLTGPAGLLTALFGMATGFAVLLIPYLMGGMGAGDVKAMAALGALSGPALILQVFLYVAFVGALISILHLLCSPKLASKLLEAKNTLRTFLYTRDIASLKPTQKQSTLRFPYAAAITLGYFAHHRWGDLV